MLNYRGWFVAHVTLASGQLFIYSVTLYAFDAVDVMDGKKFATVWESYVIISSL